MIMCFFFYSAQAKSFEKHHIHLRSFAA